MEQKHVENFYKLVKDYYDDMNELCVLMDNAESRLDDFVCFEEQHRLMLHMILDAVDQIDDEAFWEFVKKCKMEEEEEE